jgi:peptidoglycan/xylan/chitin deacetylase (PgdA/CDA1 family)
MNHPEGETAEGLIEAIPELKRRGFRFVKVSELGLR